MAVLTSPPSPLKSYSMKHAAVVYTCIGLMGTAVVAGIADYSYATNKGMLRGLYEDEVPVTTIVTSKDIKAEDFSRGPISEDYEELAISSQAAQPGKKSQRKPGLLEPPP